MDLFTNDTEIKTVQSKGSKAAQGYMMNTLGQNVSIPTQQVAELSPMTQRAMSSFQSSLPELQQYYQTAGQTYMDLAQGQDMTDTQAYRNLQSQADLAKRGATTSARQSATAMGVTGASAAKVAESAARASVDNALMSELANMEQQNIQNQMYGAQGLQNVGQARTQLAGQAATLGQIEQQNRQAQFDAVYNQALQQAIAPYNYNLSIAQSMYDPQTVLMGGGLSDLGTGISLASGFFGGGSGGDPSGGGAGSY